MDAQVYLSAQTMPIDSPDSDPLRPDLVVHVSNRLLLLASKFLAKIWVRLSQDFILDQGYSPLQPVHVFVSGQMKTQNQLDICREITHVRANVTL